MLVSMCYILSFLKDTEGLYNLKCILKKCTETSKKCILKSSKGKEKNSF